MFRNVTQTRKANHKGYVHAAGISRKAQLYFYHHDLAVTKTEFTKTLFVASRYSYGFLDRVFPLTQIKKGDC